MILHINIVTLNNLDYLKNAINSISTKHAYKLRVIDQQSTDGTIKWCEENNIEVYSFNPRVSLSEAWNYSFIKSLEDKECKYIFFPNNDVIFHKTTIDNLIEAIEKTNYLMVTGNNVAPVMDLETMQNTDEHGDWGFDLKPITNWREEGADFSCPMITRETLKKIGFFDENYVPAYKEDWDYHTRIVKSGYHAKRISKAPYYHYGSMTTKNNSFLNIYSSLVDKIHIEKWGCLEHDLIMDNKAGFNYPYNDSTKNYKYWKGCEKYDGVKF